MAVGLLAAPPARAGFICDTVGELAKWQIVTTSRLVTKWRGRRINYLGTVVAASVCTRQADIALTQIVGVHNSLTATATTATAIRFFSPRGEFNGGPNEIDDGDVATGGGAVQGTLQRLGGVIDTTGTHPTLASCRQAMIDASSASGAFAAMTPDLVFGRIVARGGREVTVDARGAHVIRIDALVAENRPLEHEDPDFPPDCEGVRGNGLFIRTDSRDDLVINVGELSIGACGAMAADSQHPLFNVTGPGKRVYIGPQAVLDNVMILAPERSVVVNGSHIDNETSFGPLWAKRLEMKGFAISYDSTTPCD
jgi:hypothetical protein